MFKDVLHTIGTRVLLIPVGIAVGAITARVLGPDDRGLFTLLLTLPATVNAFTNFGLDVAAVYFHRKEAVSIRDLLRNCIAYATVVGVVAGAGVWLVLTGPGAFLVEGAPHAAIVCAVATIPFVMLFQYASGIARAMGRFLLANRRAMAERVLFLIGLTITMVLFKGGLTTGIVTYLVVTVAVCVWLVVSVSPADFVGLPDYRILSKMLRFGSKAYAQTVASHLHYKADIYLIALFLTNADVAFYAIGMGLAERVLMLSQGINSVILPSLVSRSKHEAAILAARACRICIGVASVSAGLLALTAAPVVRLLYGAEYLPAVAPMYILLAGVICLGTAKILMQYLTSLDLQQYNSWIVLWTAVANIGLNVVIIPRFGLMGAAVASLTTYALQGGILLWVFCRVSGLPPTDVVLPRWKDHKGLLAQLRPAPPRIPRPSR